MENYKFISGFADEISQDLNKQVEVLKKLDMHYVEMRNVNGRPLISYSVEEALQIKQELIANDIVLSSVGSSIGKISITEPFDEHFKLFQHTVEIAKAMGTKYIRMFSFYIPEDKYAEYRDEVFRRIGMMVEYAEKNQVILAHENEKGIYGEDADRCKELMEQFYGPSFQMVFDFANFVQCNVDTLDAYEKLKQYICYIHIKDAYQESGKVVPAGMGNGNVENILRDLFVNGFQGFLSIEPHLFEFAGFAELEKYGVTCSIPKENEKMTGEEAFTIAWSALIRILEKIK